MMNGLKHINVDLLLGESEILDLDGNKIGNITHKWTACYYRVCMLVILGAVTSGGPSPSLGCNIAMGYVSSDHARVNTELLVTVRDKQLAVKLCKLPFAPLKYYTK